MTTTTTSIAIELFQAHSSWLQGQGVELDFTAFGRDRDAIVREFEQKFNLPSIYMLAYLKVHDLAHHMLMPRLLGTPIPNADDHGEVEAANFGSAVSASIDPNPDMYRGWVTMLESKYSTPPPLRMQVRSLYVELIGLVANEYGLSRASLLNVMEKL